MKCLIVSKAVYCFIVLVKEQSDEITPPHYGPNSLRLFRLSTKHLNCSALHLPGRPATFPSTHRHFGLTHYNFLPSQRDPRDHPDLPLTLSFPISLNSSPHGFSFLSLDRTSLHTPQTILHSPRRQLAPAPPQLSPSELILPAIAA